MNPDLDDPQPGPSRRAAGLKSEIAFLRRMLREMRDLYIENESPAFKLRFLDQYSKACWRLACLVRTQAGLNNSAGQDEDLDRVLAEMRAGMRRDAAATRESLPLPGVFPAEVG